MYCHNNLLFCWYYKDYIRLYKQDKMIIDTYVCMYSANYERLSLLCWDTHLRQTRTTNSATVLADTDCCLLTLIGKHHQNSDKTTAHPLVASYNNNGWRWWVGAQLLFVVVVVVNGLSNVSIRCWCVCLKRWMWTVCWDAMISWLLWVSVLCLHWCYYTMDDTMVNNLMNSE